MSLTRAKRIAGRSVLGTAFTSAMVLFTTLACAQTGRPVPPRAGLQNQPGEAKNSTQGNWAQLAKLVPPNFVYFQNAAAISGNTVVIGQISSGDNVAVADVYQAGANGWRNAAVSATLRGDVAEEPFPELVAIDGDTIVVAGNGGSGGYAFVYVKPPGGWTSMAPTAILSPSSSDSSYGISVGISGDVVVVCSDGYYSDSPGTAYVYVKPPGGWQDMTETARLTASDELSTDLFGYSVSISGGTIAVGATQFGDIVNPGPGKAYVFVEPSTGWTTMTQTAELTVSNAVNGEEIGFSIAVDGNTVAIGAPVFNNFLGAVFIDEKPASGWVNMTQTASLTPGDGAFDSYFGNAVAVSGGIVAVGAPYRGFSPNPSEGGVYIFERPAGGWETTSSNLVLTGSDAHYLNELGTYVSMSGKMLVGESQFFEGPAAGYIFGLP